MKFCWTSDLQWRRRRHQPTVGLHRHRKSERKPEYLLLLLPYKQALCVDLVTLDKASSFSDARSFFISQAFSFAWISFIMATRVAIIYMGSQRRTRAEWRIEGQRRRIECFTPEVGKDILSRPNQNTKWHWKSKLHIKLDEVITEWWKEFILVINWPSWLRTVSLLIWRTSFPLQANVTNKTGPTCTHRTSDNRNSNRKLENLWIQLAYRCLTRNILHRVLC